MRTAAVLLGIFVLVLSGVTSVGIAINATAVYRRKYCATLHKADTLYQAGGDSWRTALCARRERDAALARVKELEADRERLEAVVANRWLVIYHPASERWKVHPYVGSGEFGYVLASAPEYRAAIDAARGK